LCSTSAIQEDFDDVDLSIVLPYVLLMLGTAATSMLIFFLENFYGVLGAKLYSYSDVAPNETQLLGLIFLIFEFLTSLVRYVYTGVDVDISTFYINMFLLLLINFVLAYFVIASDYYGGGWTD
jgi:hypothetical protein